MDDITIACPPQEAKQVANLAARILNTLGFRVNVAKSAATGMTDDIIQQINAAPTESPISIYPPSVPFKMLGAIINSEYADFARSKMQATEAFMAKLLRLPLHPQLVWTFLRLCGSPRQIYLASTTPPQYSKPILSHFDIAMKNAAEATIGAKIKDEYLHDTLGAGFPCYSRAANDLFQASKFMALNNSRKGVEVRLVFETLPHTADLRSQGDAPYLFYSAAKKYTGMQEIHFKLAMCIRLRTLPHAYNLPSHRCDCGVIMNSNEEAIEHIMLCSKASPFTYTHRHNKVRDAIAAVARAYGITVTVEPNFYVYGNGELLRPDITFHNVVPKPITTDVSIVYPQNQVGQAAEHRAKEKYKKHEKAASNAGHKFIPFVLEIFGHRDKCCVELIRELSAAIPRHQQRSFVFDMTHAVSTALATARAETLIAATRHMTHFVPTTARILID